MNLDASSFDELDADPLGDNRETTPARETVAALEAILHKPFPILDHGFIRVVDYMGSDSAVVQAARVSYGKGTKRVSEDAHLINYLMRHAHTTPFEMCEIKLHIKLPIFVARQWVRHRTASINEYSARYSVLDSEFYIPEQQHLSAQSTLNKQGRDEPLDQDLATKVIRHMTDDAQQCYDHYEWMLNPDNRFGNHPSLARELARINLPVNFYTQWYWKINLHNFMHFVRLRADAHAQYEIRAYAEKMQEIMALWVPLCHDAFLNYKMNAVTLSEKATNVIRRKLAGESIGQENSGLSTREWKELSAAFNL